MSVATRQLTLPVRYYRRYPAEAPLGLAHDVRELDLSSTVFVVVDVYGVGFDEPDADTLSDELPSAHRGQVESNRSIVRDYIVPAKEAARSISLPIVYLTNRLSPGLNANSEFRRLGLRSYGYDVLTEWANDSPILRFSTIVAPQHDDYLIPKQQYSGFFETEFDSLLRSLGARSLVMVGFDSRICLGTTAIDAFYRNYEVIVLRDCTSTEEYVETAAGGWANFIAIRFIESCVGVTSTLAEWQRACADAARSAPDGNR